MTRALLVGALLATLFSGERALAQQMDCTVRDPNPPLNVREAPNHEPGPATARIVATLPNGTRVFTLWSDDEKWVPVAKVTGGTLRRFGYVFRKMLDCGEADRSGKYPLLIDRAADNMRRLGIDHTNRFANRCFYYGDGGYMLSISDDFKARYDRMGMPFDILCFVLRVGGFRYDPETGKRLTTYILGDLDKVADAMSSGRGTASLDPGTITEELPLEVPECFRNARRTSRERLKISGCNYRYHPWSGRPLNGDEASAFVQAGLGIDGGAAPGTPPEAANATLDTRHRRSPAQLDAEGRNLR